MSTVVFLVMVEPFASSSVVQGLLIFAFALAHGWKLSSFLIRKHKDFSSIVPSTAEKFDTVQTHKLELTLVLGGGRSSGLGLGAVRHSVTCITLASPSPGLEAGLEIGDRIVAVDGEMCAGADVTKVQRVFAKASGAVKLTVMRAGATAVGSSAVAAPTPTQTCAMLNEV